MSSPALDLLARTIAAALAERPCEDCGQRLEGVRVRVTALPDGRVGAECTCAACGGRSTLAVGPEASDGVPQLR